MPFPPSSQSTHRRKQWKYLKLRPQPPHPAHYSMSVFGITQFLEARNPRLRELVCDCSAEKFSAIIISSSPRKYRSPLFDTRNKTTGRASVGKLLYDNPGSNERNFSAALDCVHEEKERNRETKSYCNPVDHYRPARPARDENIATTSAPLPPPTIPDFPLFVDQHSFVAFLPSPSPAPYPATSAAHSATRFCVRSDSGYFSFPFYPKTLVQHLRK